MGRDITTQTPCTLVEQLNRECHEDKCSGTLRCVQYYKSSLGTKVAINCGIVKSSNPGPCSGKDIGSRGYCQPTPCNDPSKVYPRYSPVAPGPGDYSYCKYIKEGVLYDEFISIWYDYFSIFIILISSVYGLIL